GGELGRAGRTGTGDGYRRQWQRFRGGADPAADRVDHGDARLARGLLPCRRRRDFSGVDLLLVCHRWARGALLGECRRTPPHHPRLSTPLRTEPLGQPCPLEGAAGPLRPLVSHGLLFYARLYHLHLLFLVLLVFGERAGLLSAEWRLVQYGTVSGRCSHFPAR